MTAMILVPRSTWHPGPPVNNDGTTVRPKLARPVAGGLAIHYTGSPIRARNSTDDAQTYMRWLQNLAFSSKKSFEYNDIVPPRQDGTAQVWEYAGDYMAAHAGATNNPRWYAIQVAIGVNNHPSYPNYDRSRPTVWEPLTDQMVDAIRWRRHQLVEAGILAPDHEVRPHRNLPGAATACPGDAVLARWADLLVPWVASRPPTPPPPLEEEMSTAVIWSPSGHANTWLVGAGSVVHLTPELYGHYRRLGVPHITETHPQMLKSVLALSGLTTADLVPR